MSKQTRVFISGRTNYLRMQFRKENTIFGFSNHAKASEFCFRFRPFYYTTCLFLKSMYSIFVRSGGTHFSGYWHLLEATCLYLMCQLLEKQLVCVGGWWVMLSSSSPPPHSTPASSGTVMTNLRWAKFVTLYFTLINIYPIHSIITQ